jgi:hypothetical protein
MRFKVHIPSATDDDFHAGKNEIVQALPGSIQLENVRRRFIAIEGDRSVVRDAVLRICPHAKVEEDGQGNIEDDHSGIIHTEEIEEAR